MNNKNQNNRRNQNNNRYSNGNNQMNNNNRMRNRNSGRFNRPMRNYSMMPPEPPMHHYGPPPPPMNQYQSYPPPPPPPHHQSPINYSSYYTQTPPAPQAPMGSGGLGNGGHLPSPMPPSRDMYYDNRQAMGGTGSGLYNTGPIGSNVQPMYQSPTQNYSQYNQNRNQMKSGLQRGGATVGSPMPPQQPQMYGSPQMAPQVGGYGSYGGGVAGAGPMNNPNKYVGYY